MVLKTVMSGVIFCLALVGAFSIGLIAPLALNGFEVGPASLSMRAGTFLMEEKANTHDFQVREYWNNKTNYFKACKDFDMGSDEGCYMIQIYNVMKDYQYSLTGQSETNVYTPMYVLTHEEGQCSNFAYTFCRSAFQFDIDCQIECGNNHCWNIVKDYSKIACPQGECTINNETKRTYHIDVTNKKLWEITEEN